jgi:hypothetical protein
MAYARHTIDIDVPGDNKMPFVFPNPRKQCDTFSQISQFECFYPTKQIDL